MADNKLEILKDLRERTNSALIDCKRALEATNYEIEKAIAWLQENGIIKAAKKSGRIAADGIARAYIKNNIAVLFELNSETDFVAKNKLFLDFADQLQELLANSKFKTFDDVLKLKLGKLTVEDFCKDLTAKIGEKISLRRVEKLEAKKGEVVAGYTHANNKIAVIALAKGDNEEVLRHITMHIAALNPSYILLEDVDKKTLKDIEKSINASPKLVGKPEKIVENIKAGMLKKEYNDLGVLLYQPFVMEDSKIVATILSEAKLELVKAQRFEVGEGIEKKSVDFAAEVAEQMNQK